MFSVVVGLDYSSVPADAIIAAAQTPKKMDELAEEVCVTYYDSRRLL